MQNNKNRSFQNSSTKPWDDFGGVRLTVREIDVISCIFHMRGNSRIASILGISPKTVETHVFNVMRKFDCNSRENIIDFATQSGQSAILRSHYHSLLVEAFFKKKLQEISILTRNKKLSCQIIYGDRHAQNKSFLATIEDHLALAGVKTILRKREGFEFLCVRQHSESSSAEELLEMGERIDFEKQDYCLSIFEILGKLLQPLKLDQPVLECEKAYKKLRDSSVETLCRELLPQESDAEGGENQLTKKSSKGLVSRISDIPRTHLLLVFIFLLGACGFVFLGFMGDQSKHQGDKPKVFSIRSDLSIPTEATLLKRSKLLEQMDAGLKKQDGIRTVSIIGMGGSGKTTLARQYARSSDASIVWEINAETRESVLQSFEGLAYALSQATGEESVLQKLRHIEDLKEKEEKLFLFVKAKLKHFSNWVLIYDNITKMIEIQKYFPSDPGAWGKGVVVVTTRDSTIQNNAHIHDSIHIGELDREEKKTLFSKIMATNDAHPSTGIPIRDDMKFLEQISPFPLDVSIAAYYLRTTNISYEKYLKYLEEHNPDFTTTQENILKEATDYTKTRYNIISLTLKRLIETHKDFQDLLLLVSLFDSQDIPRDLLDEYKDSTVVDNFVHHLKQHSFLVNTAQPPASSVSSFSIHRSIQKMSLLYLLNTLKLDRDAQAIHKIVGILEKHINRVLETDDVAGMKILGRHCEKLLTYKDLLNKQSLGSLQGKLGAIHVHLGNSTKAQHLLEEGLEILNQCDPKNYLDIAQTLIYLGSVYRDQGDYIKAKTFLEQAFLLYKKHLPANHRTIGWALVHLGKVYGSLGDYKKSIEYLEQGIDIYKRQPVENHSKIVWTSTYLGNIYRRSGDYLKAKNTLEQALSIYQKHFPLDYFNLALVFIHLSKIEGDLGDYLKAKELAEQGLSLYKKHFSTNFSKIAWATVYLGAINRHLGSYDEAQILIEEAMALYKKYLPNNRVKLGEALAQLGAVYRDRGEFQKAQEILEETLKTFEEEYGQKHSETAHIFLGLGQLYSLKEEFEKADLLFNKALEVFQNNYHVEQYKCLERLADLYMKRSEKDKDNRQEDQKKAIYCLENSLKVLELYGLKDSAHGMRIQKKLSQFQ